MMGQLPTNDSDGNVKLQDVEEGQRVLTYSNPVANIAESPSFRFGAICKCHIAQTGSIRFNKSENTLTVLDTTRTKLRLTQ